MILLIILAMSSASSLASNLELETYSSSLNFAQVENVTASQGNNGSWCFYTSIRHNDQGWQHYADAWEVLDVDGKQLGYRKLYHPHDNEQPFTRSQCDIKIPLNTTKVIVRAKCNKHGFGGKSMSVELRKTSG